MSSSPSALSYLYDGNPKVFSVLNILNTYSQLDIANFNQRIDTDNFFKKWQGVTFKYYNQFPMIQRTPPPVDTTELGSTYDINTSYSVIVTPSGTRQSLSVQEFSDLINKLNTAVNLPIANATTINSTPFDTIFPSFMDCLGSFHETIGIYNFTKLSSVIYNTAISTMNATVPKGTSDVTAYRNKIGAELTAISHIQTYISSSTSELFKGVRLATRKTLSDIFTLYIDTPMRFQELLNVFRDVNSMSTIAPLDNQTIEPTTNQKWYMLLSGTILRNLKLNDADLPRDPVVAYRVKVLMIEIFLKSCYHIIHCDILALLILRYNQMGDFINARHSMLALCVFTYMFLKRIVSLASTTGTPGAVTVPTSINETFPTAIAAFVGILSKPVVAIENGSGVSVENVNRKVMKDLQDLSAKTQDASEDIQSLRTSIQNNQLSLQTTLSANAANAKRIYWMNVEVIVLSIVVLVLFIACSMLMFAEKTFVALIVSSIAIFVVLMYMFIDMLIRFIRSNA